MKSSSDPVSKFIKQIQPIHSSSYQPFRSLYLFANSSYTLNILTAHTQSPIHTITSQQPINIFVCFQLPASHNSKFAVVINTLSTMNGSRWVLYSFEYKKDKKLLSLGSMNGINQSASKVVNVHAAYHKQNKVLIFWIFENGNIEYTVHKDNKQQGQHTKVFRLENELNKKAEYTGRQILRGITSENKIMYSVFNHSTKTLILTIENANSDNICSIYQFILQTDEFEILTGQANLLGLKQLPKSIQLIDYNQYSNQVMIVTSGSIMIWNEKGVTKRKLKGQILTIGCTHNSQYLSVIDGQETQIHTISIENGQQLKINPHKLPQTLKTDVLFIIKEQLISSSFYLINRSLQLLKVSNQTSEIIIQNNSSNILSTQLDFGLFYNYLYVDKLIGFKKEEFLLTNNEVVVKNEQYQHNMLLKMSDILDYWSHNNKGVIRVTSPIIGTIQLLIKYTEQKGIASFQIIPNSPQQSKFNYNQETLYIRSYEHQITSSYFVFKNQQYDVQKLFDGKIDYIVAGCFCGMFLSVVVEKQIHAFSFHAGNVPKRVGIQCFDSDIKKLINLNDVNVIGVLLWDSSFFIVSLSETSTQLMNESQTKSWEIEPNLAYIHSCDITINTNKFMCTIISGYMVLVSSDSLHLYQPQKTIIITYQLSKQIFGKSIYPIINLDGQSESSEVLIRVQNKSHEKQSYRILKIYKKSLIKDYSDIKMQIEEIVGVPGVNELIFVGVKQKNYLLFCSNRITVMKTATGKIGLQQSTYLAGWIKRSQKTEIIMEIDSKDSKKKMVCFEKVLKLSNLKYLVWNDEEMWLTELSGNRGNPIAYFSMPNNGFLQFKNNLSVDQLEDPEFMKVFASKLPIKSVQKINETNFAVLYDQSLIIVEIGTNQMLIIKQQLKFKTCFSSQNENPNNLHIKITDFIGYYDEMSLYLKDSINHQLYILKYNWETKAYAIEFIEDLELDDELMCIHRVNNWKNGAVKVYINEKNSKGSKFEEIIIKKDGQMTIDKSHKPIYL